VIAFDQIVRAWVVDHRVGWLTPVMAGASIIGRGGLVWIVLAAIFAVWRRRADVMWQTALALLVAAQIADQVIKPIAGRARPFTASSVVVIGDRPHDSSFPSGHASTAFAGAFMLSGAVPEARIAWWALATLIGYSRIYLGVHFPLDIVGGALCGLACAWLVSFLLRSRRSPHRARSPGPARR